MKFVVVKALHRQKEGAAALQDRVQAYLEIQAA